MKNRESGGRIASLASGVGSRDALDRPFPPEEPSPNSTDAPTVAGFDNMSFPTPGIRRKIVGDDVPSLPTTVVGAGRGS